jgi:hypothetical protein
LIVGSDHSGLVPMRNIAGMVGFTVTQIELVGGVLAGLRGVWRRDFGSPLVCPGEVVVELLACPAVPADPGRVAVRVSVAETGRWRWVGHASQLGRNWPTVIGPLVWLECQRTLARPRREVTAAG